MVSDRKCFSDLLKFNFLSSCSLISLLLSSVTMLRPSYVAITANQTQNNQPNGVRREDHPSSPYYLHPNENPSLVLLSSLLTEMNYHMLARLMRMNFPPKNKLKFIDGSINTPDTGDPLYMYWKRCNTMLLSWLLRLVSDNIVRSILWFDTVIDARQDVEAKFAQSNSLRISNL